MADKSNNISTLATNIKDGIEARLKDLHTSMPGIIESFNATTQLATVQPAIKRIFKTNDGETELLIPTALPLLINVLVQFPRGGGFSLTFPVKKGDECLLVFCERSIDYWHKFGSVKEPGARRFHHLSDATAFVGLSSLVNKVPNYDAINTELKKDDGSVSIKWNNNSSMDITANNNISINSNANVNIDASDINITAANDVNIEATNDVNIIADNFSVTSNTSTNNGTDVGYQHIHSQEPDSDGSTEEDTGFPHS